MLSPTYPPTSGADAPHARPGHQAARHRMRREETPHPGAACRNDANQNLSPTPSRTTSHEYRVHARLANGKGCYRRSSTRSWRCAPLVPCVGDAVLEGHHTGRVGGQCTTRGDGNNYDGGPKDGHERRPTASREPRWDLDMVPGGWMAASGTVRFLIARRTAGRTPCRLAAESAPEKGGLRIRIRLSTTPSPDPQPPKPPFTCACSHRHLL